MELSVSHQVYVFAAMILCGALTGVVFDVFRAARRRFRPCGAVIAAQDVALWLFELAVVFATVFKVNNAAVRFYEIIGLAIGSALYFITVSEHVISLFCKVFTLASRALNLAAKPVKKLAALASRPARLAKNKLSKAFNSLFRSANCRLRSLLTTLKRKNV